MYYTIEGKRLLKILYVAGTLLGTIMINISVKSRVFHFYSFLDYTGYISTMDGSSLGSFFSYVVMIRIRQIMLFILCIFLLSPYVTYCVMVFLFSFITGSFISLLVMHFGWKGMFYGILFLMPQVIFYGITLLSAYVYIFRYHKGKHVYQIYSGHSKGFLERKPITEYRLFVALLCIVMFCAGCYCEGYINPRILKMFLPIR